MGRESTERDLLDVLAKVQLPLTNIEFHIDQYLLVHGTRLDTETRVLLAAVRDSISDVASSARGLAHRHKGPPNGMGHAA